VSIIGRIASKHSKTVTVSVQGKHHNQSGGPLKQQQTLPNNPQLVCNKDHNQRKSSSVTEDTDKLINTLNTNSDNNKEKSSITDNIFNSALNIRGINNKRRRELNSSAQLNDNNANTDKQKNINEHTEDDNSDHKQSLDTNNISEDMNHVTPIDKLNQQTRQNDAHVEEEEEMDTAMDTRDDNSHPPFIFANRQNNINNQTLNNSGGDARMLNGDTSSTQDEAMDEEGDCNLPFNT
jgi:hypothetical protein